MNTAPTRETVGRLVRDLVRPLIADEVALLEGCTPQTVRDRWRRGEFPPPVNPSARSGHRWAPGPLRRIYGDGVPFNPIEAHLATVRPLVDGRAS